MFKVILDTNIYFSAIGFDNTLLELLTFLLKNDDFMLYTSAPIWRELNEKLLSPKFDQKAKNKLTLSQKQDFLNLLESNLKFVESSFTITICRDPKDNIFLELAKEIQADFIITGDNDLSELKNFETTKICKPSEFLTYFNL